MPAFLLDYYETVSNCSKNVEKHTPALFMMYHYKTMSIYLKFGVCQTFPILLCTIFKDKFLLIFQFVCLSAVFGIWWAEDKVGNGRW